MRDVEGKAGQCPRAGNRGWRWEWPRVRVKQDNDSGASFSMTIGRPAVALAKTKSVE